MYVHTERMYISQNHGVIYVSIYLNLRGMIFSGKASLSAPVAVGKGHGWQSRARALHQCQLHGTNLFILLINMGFPLLIFPSKITDIFEGHPFC